MAAAQTDGDDESAARAEAATVNLVKAYSAGYFVEIAPHYYKSYMRSRPRVSPGRFSIGGVGDDRDCGEPRRPVIRSRPSGQVTRDPLASPSRTGDGFLPLRFGRQVRTRAASFSTSFPARFSIANPEAGSRRASMSLFTRRSLIRP